MSDYAAVEKALEAGTEPAMLCVTCPWDRNCISPPQMTKGDVDRQLAEAQARDEARMAAEPGAMPAATLIAAAALGGRDRAAEACPVLILRFRTSGGRKFADAVKTLMQSWEDS